MKPLLLCGTMIAALVLQPNSAQAASEKVVYSFKSGTDGAYPEAGLINVGDAFYGTTFGGGTSGYGTVFRVRKDGSESVVYAFKGGSDGPIPEPA